VALVIGVTGAIAAGKSSLCAYLVERHGAIHADADRVVHRMYDPGREGFDRIVARFGEDCIGADGFIDRRVLGAKVFGDAEKMKALTEAIGDIRGEIKGIIEHWRQTLPSDQLCIVEVSQLLEGPYPLWCDQSWLVAIDPEIALERLMARNGFTEAEARQRLASSRPWEERAPLVDRIVMNSTTREDFERDIDEALAGTLASFRAGTLGEPRFVQWTRDQEAPVDSA